MILAVTLLALRGWGGMVRQIELRGDRVVRPVPSQSLTEFLAVRLILDRLSVAHTAREALGYTGPPAGLRGELAGRADAEARPSAEQRAFVLFQIAQVLGLQTNAVEVALHRALGRLREELVDSKSSASSAAASGR